MESRLTDIQQLSQQSLNYGYDPWGRRVWKMATDRNTGAAECEVYFYGATGQKLETDGCWSGTQTFAGTGINTYFAGKMLSEKNAYVLTDRLGSVRGDSNGVSLSYFPWGEERGAGTANLRTKFAGYFRDGVGQDYAMARFYSATSGGFWSPDPGSIRTADSATPLSWNRYAYAAADPIGFYDPTGTYACGPGWCDDEPEPNLPAQPKTASDGTTAPEFQRRPSPRQYDPRLQCQHLSSFWVQNQRRASIMDQTAPAPRMEHSRRKPSRFWISMGTR